MCEVYDMLVNKGMEMAMEKADEKVKEAEKKSITNMVTLMKEFQAKDSEIVQKIRQFYPMSDNEAWEYLR